MRQRLLPVTAGDWHDLPERVLAPQRGACRSCSGSWPGCHPNGEISGRVAYAVMSFGGFLGIGEDYYPLPWSLLTYNARLEGYEVNVSEQQLKGAPKYSKNESWDWSDRARGQKVYDYYGAAPY